MSSERGDCEHGHAGEVLELAKRIGADHGLTVTSAALVLVGTDDETPTVIGSFNTSALVTMSDAVLTECAKHKPDGCANCDPAGKAAQDALLILRKRFEHHSAEHNRRRAN